MFVVRGRAAEAERHNRTLDSSPKRWRRQHGGATTDIHDEHCSETRPDRRSAICARGVAATMPNDVCARHESLRFRLASLLRRNEAIWLARVLTHGEYRGFLVRPSSDILIDGYFRSANTFSVEAFLSVNPHRVVAHHLHSPFQFVRAARFHVPALLLIRDPRDAIASELVRSPQKSAGAALKNWQFFYETVRPLRSSMVVATFEQVTTDFAHVLWRLNRAFGTAFAPYVNSGAADATTFDAVDQYFRSGSGRLFSSKKFDQVVGRPNAARTTELTAARSQVGIQQSRSLERARDLYEEFVNLSTE